MERWSGQVAVVTGASAGIGLATAKALVSAGMIVVGLARRKNKMEEEMNDFTGPGEFHAIECDISKEENVIEAFKHIEEVFNALAVLVNNAGIVKIMRIEEADTKDLEEVIGCNFMGVLYCTKHALKLLKENQDGAHVINVNSVAGHKVTHPSWFSGQDIHVNVYPATKFAVTALSETFINELLGSKVRVTNISPGCVLTEATQNDNLEETGLADSPALRPNDIADAILYILGTPAHVQVTQLTIKPLGERF